MRKSKRNNNRVTFNSLIFANTSRRSKSLFFKRLVGNNFSKDSDKDSVPDILDCRPYNKKRHSFIFAYPKREIHYDIPEKNLNKKSTQKREIHYDIPEKNLRQISQPAQPPITKPPFYLDYPERGQDWLKNPQQPFQAQPNKQESQTQTEQPPTQIQKPSKLKNVRYIPFS